MSQRYELHVKDNRYRILDLETNYFLPGDGWVDVNDAIACLNLYNGIGIIERYAFAFDENTEQWAIWDRENDCKAEGYVFATYSKKWEEADEPKAAIEFLQRENLRHSFNRVPRLRPKLAPCGEWKMWDRIIQYYTGQPGDSDRTIIQAKCDTWNKSRYLPLYRHVYLIFSACPNLHYKLELREETGLGGSILIREIGKFDGCTKEVMKEAEAIAVKMCVEGEAAGIYRR